MSTRPTSVGFTVLLGALAALPPLSIDMGLPAFPALERDLGTSAPGAGLTLSLFMAGFSVSQLVLGPLSDRFGRRPILLAGLVLYAVAGFLCAAAPSITLLIGLRLIEGACAASGTVMAFAITRDLFEGAAARQRLSYVAMVLSVAPVIAPTLGGWALLLGGWRAIYAFLGVAGAALSLAVFVGLAETRQRVSAGAGVLGGFARMLTHRRALGYALTNAMGFGALFAYVSGSPLVLMGRLGVSASLYGLLFALTSLGIMAGAWANSRLARDAAASRTALALALLAALLSALALLAITLLGAASLATLLPPLLVHTFSRGITAPNATHGALEPMGEIAGVASAVVGFAQMATGAISSALVALLFPGFGPTAMALVMVGFSFAAVLAWRVARRSEALAPAATAE
jgi:DHA1 family bicyclomycin/chloramphenicol resistance-like MFS transporter